MAVLNLSAAIACSDRRIPNFCAPPRCFVFPMVHFAVFVVVLHALCCFSGGGAARPFNNSISAILVFGDSTVDSGNNNYVETVFRSNYPPYGRSFANGVPTGRFSDGRLVTDFIASYTGIKEYVPPYLNPRLSTGELMTGVSFASAGSGFDPLTAQLSNVIPIEKQVEYFKEYKQKVAAAVGKKRAQAHINKAVFVVSAGTNDLVFGYPVRRQTYNVAAYLNFLLQNTRRLIQELSDEGARFIAVVSLPPIGCLPLVITFTNIDFLGNRHCNGALSTIATDYNLKLRNMLASLQNAAASVLIYADIYTSLNDLIQQASRFGFDSANAGCCGTGLVEASILCNPVTPVCLNPSKYVFFDSVHPTQETYKHLFDSLRPTIDNAIKKYHL
ncbi:GDSL esterase/lipase At5g45960-like [Andrographis paniculata]|uniref:GDSL esterase/lipase At5g45960-like n=1 Tax=Andrographis paniculata TaxID=175694 RepID=UPI0021E829F9|nr:GDSL esterase/lipase At5g45960-like [Andrographis paniculata]